MHKELTLSTQSAALSPPLLYRVGDKSEWKWRQKLTHHLGE